MLTPMHLVKSAKQVIKECDNQVICQVIDQKKLLIDVREANEYEQGFISHSINIPRGLIEFAIFDHPQIKPFFNDDIATTEIFLYCKSGGRSALAAQSLQNLGFTQVHSLCGGISGWEAKGFLVDKTHCYQY